MARKNIANLESRVDRRQFLRITAGGAALTTAGCTSSSGNGSNGSSSSGGQYPSKGIKVIINWAAGGGTDTYARQVVGPAIRSLGVQPQFTNFPGAGGLRGTGNLYRAEPDGYTMGSNAPVLIVLSYLIQQPPDIDLTKLVNIAAYSVGTFGVWAHPDYNVSSLKDVIQRYQSGEFKTLGLQDKGGDPSYVAALIMKNDSDFNWQWKSSVGYGGSAATAKALVSKEVPVAIATDGGMREYYRAGKVDAICMLHSEGSIVFSDIPTMKDTTYPTELDYISRFMRGMVFPPGTPTRKRDTIEKAIKQATQSKEVKQWEKESGNPVTFFSHEKMASTTEKALKKIPKKVDLEKLRQ
jgi:tripartite-type tricarboxylate transporter receptor subunit TctC